MAQEIRNRAELKRRRELMRVAIERRAAERLAASQRASQAVVAVATPPTTVADRVTPAVPLRPAIAHKVDDWLQEHAAVHKLRFTEFVYKRGCRAWNVDCDACGVTLSNVMSIAGLVNHLKTAKHVNALSADEDPDTRVLRHRMQSKTDDWLQEHAAVHKLRFTEVVYKRGGRAWNIGCDACGMTLSMVRGICELMQHVKSAKHVNAMSADDDLDIRVVQHLRKHTVDAWLQQHAAGHTMRFTEAVNKYGYRAWYVDCDACGMTLSSEKSISELERH
jgi:hypothetical protein